MLARIGPGTLVIVPGDREDVIVTADRRAPRRRASRGTEVVGAARGDAGRASTPAPDGRGARDGPDRRLRAAAEVLDGIREAGIFAALVDEDTYTVASEVHDLLVKTHAADPARSS